MLIRWNENRVLYISLVPRFTDAEKAKMDKDALARSIATVGALTLLTGINDVSDADWELAKPDVLPMLKRKANEIDVKLKDRIALEVVTFDVGGKSGVSNFVKLPPITCRKLLAETFSPFTLQKWEQEEVRESVRLDLKKRMEELGVEPKNKDDAEEDLEDDEPAPGPAPKSQAKK